MKPSILSLTLSGVLALGLSLSDAAISIQASDTSALIGSTGNTFDVFVVSPPEDTAVGIAAFSVDLHFLPFDLGARITGVTQSGSNYLFPSSLDTFVDATSIFNNGQSVNFGDVILTQNTSVMLGPGESALLGRVSFDVDMATLPGDYGITITGPPPGGLSQLDDINGDGIGFTGSIATLTIVPEPGSAIFALVGLLLLPLRRQR